MNNCTIGAAGVEHAASERRVFRAKGMSATYGWLVMVDGKIELSVNKHRAESKGNAPVWGIKLFILPLD